MTSFTRHCARDHSVLMRPYAGDQIRTYILPGTGSAPTRVKIATRTVVYGRELPAAALLEQIMAARDDVIVGGIAANTIYEFGPDALENPAIAANWPVLRQSAIWKLECARDFDFELVTRLPPSCTTDVLFGIGNTALKYIAIGTDRAEVIKNLHRLDYFSYITRAPVTVVTRDPEITAAAATRRLRVTEDL